MRNFKVGERVLWKDPDPNGIIQDFYEIDEIREDIARISNDFSEAEVPIEELRREDELTDADKITVRITFRSEITITGMTMSEIQGIYEITPLFSKEAKLLNAEFIEDCSAERIDDGSYSEINLQ